MNPEPFTCDLDPLTKTTLKMYMFKNVQNVQTIRDNVKSGAWQCAAVRACLVVAPLQVAAAANKAAVAQTVGAMVTRSIYGEILYNLSLSKNITQSLTTFGAQNGEDILLCFLVTADRDGRSDVLPHIDGEPCPVSELGPRARLADVRSAYKLDNVKGDVELLDVIVSRMATKHFVSH